jgi:4-amino-4-deoxy-L-arabinose transferase-like glycosyltransferase
MRLLSVLLGAVTVFAIFRFLRELLANSPWLWPAGALACAFQPLFGFVTAGVNPDALLWTCSALTFWLIALLLRHGATPRRLAAFGLVLAAGMLTKPLFVGIVPAAGVALLVLAAREIRRPRRFLTLAGVFAACAVVPILAYQVIGAAAFDHPYFGSGSTVSNTLAAPNAHPSTLKFEFSYIWQLWLPRIPGLQELFPVGLPLRDVWLSGFVGRFGWLDYAFASWVLDWYTWLALAVLIAAIMTLATRPVRLRGRWLELLAYIAGAAGIALVIGTQQYRAILNPGTAEFSQSRYLLPLLALYGGLIAVAARLAGRRAGPYVAVGIVTLAALHTIAAMLITVSRYYA